MTDSSEPELCLRPPHNVCAYEGCRWTCALRHAAIPPPLDDARIGVPIDLTKLDPNTEQEADDGR